MGPLKLRRGESPELYNLHEDIGETKNLATARPDDVARLENIAAAYEKEMLDNARPPWQKPRQSKD
jgi:hypothetical protein